MLSGKFEKLDIALIESISKGRKSISELSHVETGLWPLVEPHRPKNPMRGGLTPISVVLEGRLKCLLGQGLVAFDGKQWISRAPSESSSRLKRRD